MDLQSIKVPVIFTALFVVVSAFLLFLVYKFAVKGKSYEEALAEQRQSAQVLLGVKPKPKEKKNKKALKKQSKEKLVAENETAVIEEKVVNTNPVVLETKLEQDTQTLPEANPPKTDKEDAQKKRNKPLKNKLNTQKEESKTDNAPTVSTVKEVILVQEVQKEVKENKKDNKKEVKEAKKEVKEAKKEVKETKKEVKEAKKEVKEAKKEQNETNKPIEIIQESIDKVVSSKSESKPLNGGNKKPTPSAIPAQQQNKIEPPSVEKPKDATLVNGFLPNSIKDKKKKKSDLYVLQQLVAAETSINPINLQVLLNLVRKAELSRADVQVLIDLLLNKQHELPLMLDEWSEGKADPIQKLKKQLAEKEKLLKEEQEALVGAQAKLKEIRNEHLTDRSSLQQKIKALEESIQAKHIEAQANNNRYQAQAQTLQQTQAQLNDEKSKVFNLAKELKAIQLQHDQLGKQIAQETDVLIAQLRQDNAALTQELQAAENAHKQTMKQLSLELEQKNDYLEDVHCSIRAKDETIINMGNDIARMGNEIARLSQMLQDHGEGLKCSEDHNSELQNEICDLRKQNDESYKIITQLKSDLHVLKEEKLQTNGTLEKNKSHEIEILNLHNEISSLKTQLQQNENKHQTELKHTSGKLEALQQELDQQRNKNNELRNKNHKVMEALNVAESRIKNAVAEPKVDLEKIQLDTELKQKQLHHDLYIRLFPDVKDLPDVHTANWQEKLEAVISRHLESVREDVKSSARLENEKLTKQVQHYRRVIDETEGALSKLQDHVENGELDFHNQLVAKDAEINALKEKLSTSENENL